jgi:hypothetical protein
LRILTILFLLHLTVGCAVHEITFMKPEGEFGKASKDGCGQIPLNFIYDDLAAKFKVLLNARAVYLSLVVPEGSTVEWYDSSMSVEVSDLNENIIAESLIKDERIKEVCSGIGLFSCKKYDQYYLFVEAPQIYERDNVKIKPPTPLVNGKAIKTSEINFKKVTENIVQAINC